MKLHTKDYVNFKILDELGNCIKQVEGVEYINRVLPGDEVALDGTLVKRANHPLLVGIVHFISKIKYGMTSKGVPIYLFEPLNKAYPIMIAGSTHKGAKTNIFGIARFESWDATTKYPRVSLIKLLGPCGEERYEKEALIHRYSPWPYPKDSVISPTYADELATRELLQGFTFNIDPPGCEDVDDVFTIQCISSTESILTISITDIASAIHVNSSLDLYAKQVGQSLYPTGQAPKHMLPPSIGIQELSLLPGKERNCISLSIYWSIKLGVTGTKWALTKVKVDKAYTYKEAQQDIGCNMTTLWNIVNTIGKPVKTSEEWVETLMIYYNKEAGRLLKKHATGILRNHTQPEQAKLERWAYISPELEKLAYSSAEYVPADIESKHWGLDIAEYAHASSPLRRYADLQNQRALIAILKGEPIPVLDPFLCKQLNILQKDAKSFERDEFFLCSLASTTQNETTATLVEIDQVKQVLHFWVAKWNRIIRVKTTLESNDSQLHLVQRDTNEKLEIHTGFNYRLRYYINYQNARWKDKIIFSVSL